MNNSTTIKNTIQPNNTTSTNNATGANNANTQRNTTDNLAIMSNLRNYMAEKNRMLKGWLVIWASAIGTILLNGVDDYMGKGNHMFLTILAGALLFLASCAYVSKYTKQGELPELMVSHAFDGKTYYGILSKRLIPLQAGSLLAIVIAAIFQKPEITTALLNVCMTLVLPQLSIAIIYLAHEKNVQGSKLWPALISAGKIVEGMFRIITLGAAFVEFTLFFLTTFGINPLMEDIGENTPVCFQLQDDFLLILCFVFALFISLLYSDIGVESPVLRWIRFRKGAVILLLLVQIGCAVFYCYSVQNKYVRLMEDSITIKNGDMVKTYTMDEIVYYRIYANESALAMEVTFTDNTKQSLLWNSTEENKAWSDKYDSCYNYVAELTGRLKAVGITGILENESALDASVETCSSSIQSAYEQIKENLR